MFKEATERFTAALRALSGGAAPPDPWEDDAKYPPSAWQEEVAAGDTRSGYRDWVTAQREAHIEGD